MGSNPNVSVFRFRQSTNYYVCEITNVPFIMAPPLVL